MDEHVAGLDESVKRRPLRLLFEVKRDRACSG
jgi:hypothetical protein